VPASEESMAVLARTGRQRRVDPKWGIADRLRDSGSRSRRSSWPGSVVAPVAGAGTDEETRPSR
jgi:hypothetical protein